MQKQPSSFSQSELAALWQCFLWQDLSSEERQTLLTLLPPPERLPKGTQLYRSGHLGLLLDGSAKIYNADGSVIMRELPVSEVFGSASLFGAGVYAGHILADTAVCLLYLSEEDFRRILLAYPAVSMQYIAFLSGRIRFLNGKIYGFTADSAEDALLRFCRSIGADREPVKLPCSMQELATRLHIGRSSLYRALDTLTQNGILQKQNRTIYIKE